MLLTQSEFVKYIDSAIPDFIKKEIESQLEKMDLASLSSTDLANMQEHSRVMTIKHLVSNTHSWQAVTSVDSKGFQEGSFWCEHCGIRASSYEYIRALSVIEKVNDNLPTYDAHNQYLTLTCRKVNELTMTDKSNEHCIDCNIAKDFRTDKCKSFYSAYKS